MIGTVPSNSKTETVQKSARALRKYQGKQEALVAMYTDGTDVSELCELQCNALNTSATAIHVEDTDVAADRKIAETFSEQCRVQYNADLDGIKYNEQWYIDAIIDYRKINGKEPVRSTCHNGLAIGSWINHRSQDFKNGKLSPDRIKVFRAAGVKLETTVRETVGMNTDETIALLEYCHKNKINVKRGMERIMYKGNMVNPETNLNYLRSRKWSKLTQKQLQRLAAINVVKDALEQKWMNKFTAWKAKAVNGVVEMKHTTEYKWQNKQRQAAKGQGTGVMTPERKALLDTEGFKW
jgi:hypothetical protein